LYFWGALLVVAEEFYYQVCVININFRHRSEPAVSLVYSDKSSTGAKISLGLGDEVSRELRENRSRNSLPGN
jgi:hypothetical protein